MAAPPTGCTQHWLAALLRPGHLLCCFSTVPARPLTGHLRAVGHSLLHPYLPAYSPPCCCAVAHPYTLDFTDAAASSTMFGGLSEDLIDKLGDDKYNISMVRGWDWGMAMRRGLACWAWHTAWIGLFCPGSGLYPVCAC
jgi:hypothetical protein